MDYSQCILSVAESHCGPYKPANATGLVLCYELLQTLVDVPGFTEKQLIESRLKYKLDDNSKICEHHRNKYGLHWVAPSFCLHPEHINSNKKCKKTSLRRSNLDYYYKINAIYENQFPLLGNVCRNHRTLPSTNENLIEDTTEDPDYVLDQSAIKSDISLQDANEFLANSVEETFSPLKFQINSTPVQDLSKTALKYHARKLNQAVESFQKTYVKHIAPLQEEDFLNSITTLIKPTNNEDSSKVNTELNLLIDAYKYADTNCKKILILSSIPPESYSKSKIMKEFSCSRYIVDESRKLRAKSGALIPIEIKKFQRKRLNINSARHFLDFLFSSGLIQDIAYGTNTLIFSSGQKQLLPKSILTLSRNHTIQEYKHYCSNTNFEALSDSSLWKILKAVKPSQRHSLAGLDDTTKSGLDGFSTLHNILTQIEDKNKDLFDRLENGKRYLKHGYSTHCTDESSIPTHCISHALFNELDEAFQPEHCNSKHDSVCTDCNSLLEVLHEIQELVKQKDDGNEKDELTYDVTVGVSQIFNWMRHIIRAVKQNQAKLSAMDQLDDVTALWLCDWAQKILPVKFREGQRDYFGKKGMSLSVDVLLKKCVTSGEVQKSVYLTSIYRCDQDTEDTLCVGDHVLQQIKKDHPKVTHILRKSDNAGCYAGNSVAEVMAVLCKKYCIQLDRYDYNEPQKGKDQADRESAICKSYIKAYVDSGNDCTSAEDVASGIKFRGGPANTKVSIIEIDKQQTKLTQSKIINIQSYHSIKYTEKGMTFWQYFDTGVGKFVEYSGLEFTSGVNVIKSFDECMSESEVPVTKKRKYNSNRLDRKICNMLLCTQRNCIATFQTKDELEDHIKCGNHQDPNRVTSIDYVKSEFANLVQEQSHNISVITEIPEILNEVSSLSLSLHAMFKTDGWALPKRSNKRFTYKQKKFLYDEFMMGEESGRKTTAEKVVQKMRKATVNLKKMFATDDYLTQQQVTSAFSRMSKMFRNGNLQEPTEKSVLYTNEATREVHPSDTSDVFISEVDESLREVLQKISADDITIGQFVIVALSQASKKPKKTSIKEHFVGQVISSDVDEVEINFLKKKRDYYWWPEKSDKSFVDVEDVHALLSIPDMDGKEHVHFSEHDKIQIERCCC